MKITIVATNPNGAHQQELKVAAERRGHDTTVVDVTAKDVSNGQVAKKLAGAVLWRSSSLDLHSERTSLLPLLEKKIVASDSLFLLPMTRFKYFQQQLLQHEPATKKWSIPTYKFKTRKELRQAIESGELALPLIAKPNAGARGEGIFQVHTVKEITAIEHISTYVFQSFILNDCDWRIIVVGGAPLGILKRQAQNGHFLNNISQGAKAVIEDDPATIRQLNKIATKIASIFHLTFCGVDIIRNKVTGELYVLEVNTAPQWRDEFGFANMTGVDVPGAVIDWVEARDSLSKVPLPVSVETYYKDRLQFIPTEAFHFASRLWLWTYDDWSRAQLDARRAAYVGTTDEEIDAMISGIVARAEEAEGVNHKKSHRREAFSTHDKLSLYNTLLFKVVFCDSLYKLDIRPFVRKYVSDKDFLAAFNELINDPDSVRLLSTHAINFFYLLKNYFKDTVSLASAVVVSPYELLDLLPGYELLEKKKIVTPETSLKLQTYLLTHAIIGQSRFYARKVPLRAFKTLCERLEQLITDNYYNISLDSKFEFLVCAEICGYETSLRRQIQQEAEQSVSWAGNFLVDTINMVGKSRARHCLRISEHRNVLYMLSNKEFVRRKATTATKPKRPGPRTIGRLAQVVLPSHNIRRAIARVDSGATRSAIAASNVFVDDEGVLHYTLMHSDSHLFTGQEFTTTDFQVIRVKSTSAYEDRYAITMEVEVENHTERILFTLASRQHMLFPVLLGRNFLTGKYRVDTSRQFVKRVKPKKSQEG